MMYDTHCQSPMSEWRTNRFCCKEGETFQCDFTTRFQFSVGKQVIFTTCEVEPITRRNVVWKQGRRVWSNPLSVPEWVKLSPLWRCDDPTKKEFVGLFVWLSCVHTQVHISSCDMKTSPGSFETPSCFWQGCVLCTRFIKLHLKEGRNSHVITRSHWCMSYADKYE